MNLESRLSPDACALVLVDVQNDFCDPEGVQARLGKDVSSAMAMATRVEELIEHARRAGVPVVFVRTTHDASTDSPAWLSRRGEAEREQSCRTDSWGARFYAVAPSEGELVVEKHRYGAFTGTALAERLREMGRTSLLFCGVATNICVETSLREAVCLDFFATLVRDGCAAYSAEAQRGTIDSVRSGFGLVTDAATVAAHWAGTLEPQTSAAVAAD